MKKQIKGLSAMVLVLAILAVSKPGPDSFNVYVDKHYSESRANNNLNDIINQSKNKLIAVQMKNVKKYNDRFLFSTVTTYQLEKEVRFLGILGTWISIR